MCPSVLNYRDMLRPVRGPIGLSLGCLFWLALFSCSSSRFDVAERDPKQSCSGRCGQVAVGSGGQSQCGCDKLCATRGDCCGDYPAHCQASSGGSGGLPPSGGSGGIAGQGMGGGGLSGGSGGGGSGGTAGIEICDNGADDDGDLKTDCADSDCVTHQCVPAAPTNWTGPVWLYKGGKTAPVPSCPSGAAPAVNANADFDPGSIDCGCGCKTPTGGSCKIAGKAAASSEGACPLAAANTVWFNPSLGQCTALPQVHSMDPRLVKPAPLALDTVGSCASTKNVTVPAPPGFNSKVRACSVSLGAGCGSQKCWKKPPASFGAKACVYRSGNYACPGGFSKKHSVFDSFNDTRSCTCSCGTAKGQSCVGNFRAYSGAGCTSEIAGGPFPADPNKCVQKITLLKSIKYELPSLVGGTCSAGEVVSGTVKPTSATTVCCIP